ncbi:MAG: hypothetical protein GY708_31280 [Actinomycetia bacterium]|nr:hypothetical protein [Actinomycetes bacterium]MCP4958481.1 hypothetical protein [Actinomycetes bacterium]
MFAPCSDTIATVEVSWGSDVRLFRFTVAASLDSVVRLEGEDSLAGADFGAGDQVLLRWITGDGSCAVRAVVRSMSQGISPSLVLELPATPERRVRTRTDGDWACRYKLGDGDWEEGILLELGVGGTRLVIRDGEVGIGDRVEIQLENVAVGGRVVGILHSPSSNDELRIRFEDLGLEDLIAIGELIGSPLPHKR